MHHIAIMKKTWNMIPKIVAGEKTIESRWYATKRLPWEKIAAGDTVYFKNSGELVTAQATVSKVLQFSIADIQAAEAIIKKYGTKICLRGDEFNAWNPLPKYCILIFLEKPKIIPQPFNINKKGFGTPTAWLTIDNVNKIKML
jgi:ASC-1-like (ASCH) protein